MKKLSIKLFISMFSVMLLLGIAVPATTNAVVDPLATVCSQNGSGSSTVCKESDENPIFGPKGVITRVTQLVATLVGVAAVIMIIFGGLRYVNSTGDPQKTKSAKDTILFAVIGIVIALVAQTIVFFVLKRL